METETAKSFNPKIMTDRPEEIDLEIFKNFSEDIERSFKQGIESIERNFKENLLEIKSLFFDKMGQFKTFNEQIQANHEMISHQYE